LAESKKWKCIWDWKIISNMDNARTYKILTKSVGKLQSLATQWLCTGRNLALPRISAKNVSEIQQINYYYYYHYYYYNYYYDIAKARLLYPNIKMWSLAWQVTHFEFLSLVVSNPLHFYITCLCAEVYANFTALLILFDSVSTETILRRAKI
jgi:hypothetical protein